MSYQCQKCGKETRENVLLCEECNVPEPKQFEQIAEPKKKRKKEKSSGSASLKLY